MLVGGVVDDGIAMWIGVRQMRGIIQRIEIYLDDGVNIIARLAIIIAIVVILIGISQLAFWLPHEPRQTRAGEALMLLHSNWRALIVVAVPLFYPSIRKFLEEVRQIGWVHLPRNSGDKGEGMGREDGSNVMPRRRDDEADDS